jgi:NAD-dependent dihydropyrimidine dehydrogenase PreA subunit
VFTVSPDALRKESARALQRVAMAVNIPGFRRGKAPAALLQSKYAEDIENEIKRMLVYTAYDKIDAADAGEMLNCNLEKDIQINKDADTVFTMIADIAPEFEVGDYKALKVEAAAADVSDEQVEERVNFYRTMYANYAEVTEAAAAGDQYFDEPLVNIISFACNACPTKQLRITDSCQGCVSHPCQNSCPKGAIYLDERKRCHIDQSKCIKCGKCEAQCPYNAISRIERPCAAACGMDAIESDELGRA